MNHIKGIGIEIEGAWLKTNPKTGAVQPDGSVSGFSSRSYVLGEVALGPFFSEEADTISSYFANIESVANEYFPDKTNSTCGVHFHFSTKRLADYVKLMRPEFYVKYRKAIEEYAQKTRLSVLTQKRIKGNHLINYRGKNKNYCFDTFAPEQQYTVFKKYDEGRYRQLNFCFAKHGTLECRVFSAKITRKKLIASLRWLFKFINDYLDEDLSEMPNDSTEFCVEDVDPSKEEVVAVSGDSQEIFNPQDEGETEDEEVGVVKAKGKFNFPGGNYFGNVKTSEKYELQPKAAIIDYDDDEEDETQDEINLAQAKPDASQYYIPNAVINGVVSQNYKKVFESHFVSKELNSSWPVKK